MSQWKNLFTSLQCHPDKLPSSLSDKERASAIEQFHKIKRAYEILSDDKERQTYDTTSNGELIIISRITGPGQPSSESYHL